LKSDETVGNILQIRTFSYMEIRTYFHLPCNYFQTNLIIRIPLPPPTKNSINTLPFPTLQFFAEAVHMDKPKISDISKNC